jgi:hypothetical protein
MSLLACFGTPERRIFRFSWLSGRFQRPPHRPDPPRRGGGWGDPGAACPDNGPATTRGGSPKTRARARCQWPGWRGSLLRRGSSSLLRRGSSSLPAGLRRGRRAVGLANTASDGSAVPLALPLGTRARAGSGHYRAATSHSRSLVPASGRSGRLSHCTDSSALYATSPPPVACSTACTLCTCARVRAQVSA